MLITIAVILIILWLLGLITSTFGGVIYVLWGIGVLLLLARAFQGQRV